MSVPLFRRRRALPKVPVEEAPVGEKVSKKDRAFELFAQGKTPDDPELEALGLAPSTIKKYFGLWKQE